MSTQLPEITARLFEIVDDVMERDGLSLSRFEREIGVYGIFSNYRTRGLEPKASVLAKVLTRYPEYSADYLLMGVGEMRRQPDKLLSELENENSKLIRLNMALQERLNEMR